MRRTAPVVSLVLVALILGAPPAIGTGEVTWSDPAGDATGLDPLPPPAPAVASSSPRPSDAELDLRELSLATDGTKIIFSATTTAFGVPAGATGATVRFVFEFAGVGYQLIAQRTSPEFATAISTALFFRAREPRSPELACRECQVVYDPKTKKVTVVAQIASLASGIKAHASAAKFGPGSKISGIRVIAQRNLVPLERSVDVGRTLTVDVADAGPIAVNV
jgi:hypothetical protein